MAARTTAMSARDKRRLQDAALVRAAHTKIEIAIGQLLARPLDHAVAAHVAEQITAAITPEVSAAMGRLAPKPRALDTFTPAPTCHAEKVA